MELLFITFCLQPGLESVTGYVKAAKHQETSQAPDCIYIEGSLSLPVQRIQERHSHTLVPLGAAATQGQIAHDYVNVPPEECVTTAVLTPHESHPPSYTSKTHDYMNLPPEECVTTAVPTPHESHPPSYTSITHDYVNLPPEESARIKTAVPTVKESHPPICTSETHDYVNLPPEKSVRIIPAVPTPKEPKKPQATPRSYTASVETDGVISRRKSDYSNLPKILHSSEGDEDNCIEMEIQDAIELATSSEQDAQRDTLKHVPFDPFLKCLYCNRMFRYGEIQKYKKHVLTCTESSLEN